MAGKKGERSAAGAKRGQRAGAQGAREKGFLIKGPDGKLYYIGRAQLLTDKTFQLPPEIEDALRSGVPVIDVEEYLTGPDIGIWPCNK